MSIICKLYVNKLNTCVFAPGHGIEPMDEAENLKLFFTFSSKQVFLVFFSRTNNNVVNTIPVHTDL